METTRYDLNAPCRIALITDVHNSPSEQVQESLRENRPELICIAGDLFYGCEGARLENEVNVLPLLRVCCSTAPTFCSIGNHDWILEEEDLRKIRELGVTVLDNEWRRCGGIIIGGLTSAITLSLRETGKWVGAKVRARKPEVDWLGDLEAQDGYRILLSHHPEYYTKYLEDRDIDMVFSGHAHGGQWRFFGRGIYAPGQGLFPRYTSGVHPGPRGKLVISRGLSNPTRIPRINNRPEIIYIR